MTAIMRPPKLLAAMALLCTMLLAPALASAYCVYNHTDVTLRVCGGTCLSCLAKTVHPGEKACCPGGDKGCSGGKYVIIGPKMKNGITCSGCYVPHKVDSHGWVSIHGTCKSCPKNDCDNICDGLSAEVYDSDGKQTYGGKLEITDDGC